jgi:hypothetical protein
MRAKSGGFIPDASWIRANFKGCFKKVVMIGDVKKLNYLRGIVTSGRHCGGGHLADKVWQVLQIPQKSFAFPTYFRLVVQDFCILSHDKCKRSRFTVV